VIPSVSIKDRSLLVPLVMLNACLTFSWPSKVPFDRKASDTIRDGINSDWQTGAEGVKVLCLVLVISDNT
jgi:hypothetical protein